jgi:hypothetical protein
MSIAKLPRLGRPGVVNDHGVPERLSQFPTFEKLSVQFRACPKEGALNVELRVDLDPSTVDH